MTEGHPADYPHITPQPAWTVLGEQGGNMLYYRFVDRATEATNQLDINPSDVSLKSFEGIQWENPKHGEIIHEFVRISQAVRHWMAQMQAMQGYKEMIELCLILETYVDGRIHCWQYSLTPLAIEQISAVA